MDVARRESTWWAKWAVGYFHSTVLQEIGYMKKSGTNGSICDALPMHGPWIRHAHMLRSQRLGPRSFNKAVKETAKDD